MDSKLKEHLLKVTSKEDTSWLDGRTILLAQTGSHAYGTNIEDSDKDFKGICIPPKDFFLGLNSYNEYNSSGGKNFKNTKDDIDVNIIHINKFVLDAMKGSPNNIELLFIDKEDYLRLTELGEILVDNRHLFISKTLKSRFRGYAKGEIDRMEMLGRAELIEKYGYDTKMFMHSARLLTSAIEILKTGTFTTRRPNRDFLLECRRGKYSLKEAHKIVIELDRELESAYINSTIQEEPDKDKINSLLISINEKALNMKTLI